MTSPFRRPALRCLAGALLATAMLLSACSSSGFRYVKSNPDRTYYKVPGDWRVYDETEIISSQLGDLSPERAAATADVQWVTAFDGDPKPSLNHVLDPNAPFPAGLAQVRTLSTDEHDSYSLSALRNEMFPIDTLSTDPGAEVERLSTEDLVRPGGFHGTRIIYNLRLDPNGGFLTFDQTALLDPATDKVYVLVLGCEANCYLKYRKTIDQIASSWTVKEK